MSEEPREDVKHACDYPCADCGEQAAVWQGVADPDAPPPVARCRVCADLWTLRVMQAIGEIQGRYRRLREGGVPVSRRQGQEDP